MATNDPFAGMTPEMVKEIFGLSPLDDQQGQLQQQINEAIAMRKHPQPEYTTGLGAGLGAAGHVLTQYGSMKKEDKYRDQMQQNSGQIAAKRQTLYDAWIAKMRADSGYQPEQQGGAPTQGDGSYGGSPYFPDEAD